MHCKDQNQLGPAATAVAAIRISSAKQRSVRQKKTQHKCICKIVAVVVVVAAVARVVLARLQPSLLPQ